MRPARPGTEPGTLASEMSEKMPSMARRPAERSVLDERRGTGYVRSLLGCGVLDARRGAPSGEGLSSTRVEARAPPVDARPTSQVPRRVGTVVDLHAQAPLLLGRVHLGDGPEGVEEVDGEAVEGVPGRAERLKDGTSRPRILG